MKILVVGSGGREHAIIWAIKQSNRKTEVFCANGNAGIAGLADCVDIKPTDIAGLADFAVANSIDLTFVGGETSLALGIVDEFQQRDLRIVGATRGATRLESSKAFAKDFMRRHRIPTAGYRTAKSNAEAVDILKSGEFGSESSPVVVKADGLAAGKGVVVAENREEAIAAIESMTSGKLIDAQAAKQIVVEECLFGKEISLLLFSDGKNFSLMPPTRDHKRIGEGDIGPNTGGMGAITDSNLLTEIETESIVNEIVNPTLRGAESEGFPFSGILFLGLMMTKSGPKVIEYNVRFGDPETQAILVNLETDFISICEAIVDGTLDRVVFQWRNGSSACVVLAAENYPASPRTGDVIAGLEEAQLHSDIQVFHAGTSFNDNGDILTSGGRVLAITSTANNLSAALHRAYKAANEVSWNGMYFRRDIGK